MKKIIISPAHEFDGRQLKSICARQGVPLWRLARQCHIHQSRLSDYVTGRRLPDIGIVQKLASKLGIDAVIFYKKNEQKRISGKHHATH